MTSKKKSKSKQKSTKKIKAKKKYVIKGSLGFIKIDVGCAHSLALFTDLFNTLGFKQGYTNDRHVEFTDGATKFVVYHGKNVSGSGVYVIDTGINALFFKVKDKQAMVDFYARFILPRKIRVRFGDPMREDERENSLFFDTPEHITVGIVSEK